MEDSSASQLDSKCNSSDPRASSPAFRKLTILQCWPLALFVAILLLLDFSFTPVERTLLGMFQRSWLSNFVSVVGQGSLAGQICLTALVMGLLGRSWLIGFVNACLLGMLGVIALVLGAWVHRTTFDLYEILLPLLQVPIFLLMISLPVLIFRVAFGWRLSRSSKWNTQSYAIGLEDLLIGTAVVAGSIMFLRSSLTLSRWESNGLLPTLTIIAIVLGLFMFLAILPSVWIAFRIVQFPRRLNMLLVLASTVSVLVVSIVLVVALWTEPNIKGTGLAEIVGSTIAYMFGTFLTVIAGLCALRASGFELAQKPIPFELNPEESLGEHSPQKPTSFWNLDRKLAALVFAMMATINFGVSQYIADRNRGDRGIQLLNKEFNRDGGNLEVDEKHNVIGLQLKNFSTVEDLQKHYVYSDLRSLNLAGNSFRDEDLLALKPFKNLRKLDLSNTRVSDRGIETLKDMKSLNEVALGETKVTISGINRLLDSSQIVFLDLSNHGLTDSNLEELTGIRTLGYLRLAASPITDEGLRRLPKMETPMMLDLSDCEIDGHGLAGYQVEDLRLDGTDLTDSSFREIVSTLQVKLLSIRRTALTDGVLPNIAASQVTGLALGDSGITEKGLSQCSIQRLRHLGLNSLQFDGSCFATWKPKGIAVLDLCQSGVNDETIEFVSKIECSYLNLAHTKITDRSLQKLRGSKALSINIRGTAISASGLECSGLEEKKFYIDIDQFPIAELSRLRKRFTLLLGTAPDP